VPFRLKSDEDSTDALSLALGQLQRLDGAIEKEFTLVSDRMVWMVVSESFIFGAFATAAVAYDPDKTHLGSLVAMLLIGLPIIGIIIAGFAHRAIQAAHDAAERLKAQREPLERYFHGPLYVQLPARDWETHAQGNVPSRYLGPIFMLSWFVFSVVLAGELTARTFIGPIATAMVVIFLGGVAIVARWSFTRTIGRLAAEVAELESRVPRRGAPEAGGGATRDDPA
jgi:hypothetical protein